MALRAPEECLRALGEDESGTEEGVGGAARETEEARATRLADGNRADAAAMCALRGRAYDAMENRARATRAYALALRFDPMCYEAYDAVLSGHALSESEEGALVDSLVVNEENAWIKEVYAVLSNVRDVESELLRDSALGEEDASSQPTTSKSASDVLKTSGDVRIARARRLYDRGEFAACYTELRLQYDVEPSRLDGMPLYFATLVELGKKNDLYLLAHSLVDEYPKKALTWFGIGCYYMATKQFDQARKYFSKATTMDASFVQAWIGFGHAFAAQDESDQAMAAYRTAARLFSGTHVPVMSIGIEYQRTNNLSLAYQFFRKSFEISQTDPLLYNEYGVLLYREGQYESAAQHFERALELAPTQMTSRWESLIVNMAQALRKVGRYDDAIAYFEYALSITPRAASTYAALAFTYQVKSRCTEPRALGLAIVYYLSLIHI